MSSIATFVESLRREGIELWLEGDQLHYHAPAEALPHERLLGLRSRKSEVVSFLQAAPIVEPRLRPLGLEGPLPLSWAQKAFLSYYDKLTNPALQASWWARRLRGHIDESVLEQSFGHIVTRHAALRTRYGTDPAGAKYVLIDTQPRFEFESSMLDATDPDAQEEEIATKITGMLSRRFDLQQGPMLRVLLLRAAPESYVLLISAHHSICDGWSLGVLLRELHASYQTLLRAQAPTLPTLPIQYTDHARWLERCFRCGLIEDHLAYWRQLFSGMVGPFDLPRDVPAIPKPSESDLWTGFRLSGAPLQALRALARSQTDTPANFALTAFAIVLAHWRGEPDVLIKTIHHGRHRSELYDVMGCFANCSAVRASVNATDSFGDVLAQVRENQRQSLPHLDVPWWHIRQELGRLPGEQPLLDIHFNYQAEANGPAAPRPDADPAALRFEELALKRPLFALGRPDELEESAGFVLNVILNEQPDSLTCAVRYIGSRFSATTIDALCRNFLDLLRRVADRGSDAVLVEDGLTTPFPRPRDEVRR